MHRVLFGLVTALGGLFGLFTTFYTSRLLQGLSPMTFYASQSAVVILGLVIGTLLATPAAELASDALDGTLASLQRLSLGEIVLGSLGLIIGLGLAFFVSLAVQSLQFSAVPVVGVWLGPVLILLSALLFGGLGSFIGFRLSAVSSFREVFEAKASARRLQILIDTSIVVDGRLGAVLETGFLDAQLVVPQFVLGELQFLADSEDPLRRVRGRRGLDFLEDLRTQMPFEVVEEIGDARGVDQKLIKLARHLQCAILTNDYNLQKVAAVQGLKVLNLNQLASALKPSVLPGQLLQLNLVREGKEHHQAVGFFEDGTMVVVERGRPHIGHEVITEVTSVMQTATGKMVFSRFRHLAEPESNEVMAAVPTSEDHEAVPMPSSEGEVAAQASVRTPS